MDVGRDFHHPYEPYDIQVQLMKAIYDCLEDGKVGIFESPTDEARSSIVKGKSLSLICASLTWLRDHKRRIVNGEDTGNDSTRDDEPEWMKQHERNAKRNAAFHRQQARETRLAKIREKEEQARQKYESSGHAAKRQKTSTHVSDANGADMAEFILEEYESEHEEASAKAIDPIYRGLSAETRALLEKHGTSVTNSTAEKDVDYEDEMKIIYCSRTHSQLSQFANELRRVNFPPVVLPEVESVRMTTRPTDTSQVNLKEIPRHVTLGSRKNLCINAKVNKLHSQTAINDRCLEIQKSGTPADVRCSYLPNKDNQVLVNDFRDHALAKIRDIEDFGVLGRKIGICPYYASRAAIKPAEIVTLPYPLLLQKAAREALDLSLKDHIVIIDEAHNLMDAIMNTQSTAISLAQLKHCRAQLMLYLQKFKARLKGKNRFYLAQLIRLLDSLSAFITANGTGSGHTHKLVQVFDMVSGKGVDQINLHKLMLYLQESRLARKVDGYSVFVEAQNDQANSNVKIHGNTSKSAASTSALTIVQGFLAALTNPALEGNFFLTQPENSKHVDDMTLKYMLLDPTRHFQQIIDEARAVVLVGGTMSPINDYTNYLFSYLPLDRIVTLSCGHVIPSSNLIAQPISEGPTGVGFDFTFEKRNSPSMIRELGHSILEITKSTPDGLVVFFPSYAYLDTAIEKWQNTINANDTHKSLWSQMGEHKRIFLEPKSSLQKGGTSRSRDGRLDSSSGILSGNTTDELLRAYTNHISLGNGGLLFAVIGGTLSEGINFSDALGRGIVVVGLPFPNVHSPEWKAKISHLRQRAGSSGGAGDFLENTCMRAVNQSVGRAIRHRGDFAAITLLDGRYKRDNIQSKLPGWIQESLVKKKTFKESMAEIVRFFDNKK